MAESQDRRNDPRQGRKRYWPDAVFRVALIVWLILGLTSILKAMLLDHTSVAHVLLVAWGVIVIFVLWFRMGPPRNTNEGSQVFR